MVSEAFLASDAFGIPGNDPEAAQTPPPEAAHDNDSEVPALSMGRRLRRQGGPTGRCGEHSGRSPRRSVSVLGCPVGQAERGARAGEGPHARASSSGRCFHSNSGPSPHRRRPGRALRVLSAPRFRARPQRRAFAGHVTLRRAAAPAGDARKAGFSV